MEGGGAYNRSSRVQAAGLLPAVALLEDAALKVRLTAGSAPLVIVDYGSSEGRNSLLPIGTAVSALRARAGPTRAISVVHTDLPDNDFAALFRTVESDPETYLRDGATFVSAIGRSFYQQLLPAESVTLGWSSWAVQWLSRLPAPIPDQVQVAFSKDAGTREAFARQAAEDWRAFLAARGREMCPGARLVVLTMAVDEARDFGYRPLLHAMYAGLEDLMAERFITADELHRMAIPTVGRSHDDLAAPFVNAGSFAGLSPSHLEVFQAEDRIFNRFEGDGDAQAFGASWAAFSRASVFPTLAAALGGGRSDARFDEFLQRLEAALASRLAAAPTHMSIPLAKLLLIKA
jgi:hypothetical protein